MSKRRKDELHMQKEVGLELNMQAVENSFDLLSLPHLILDMILDDLDLSALKKLRLVLKATKSLVEQARHLYKFQIDINHGQYDILNNLLESSVQWNSFKNCDFDVEQYSSETTTQDYSSFIRHYGPFIKHCNFRAINAKNLVEFLSCITSYLESLIIKIFSYKSNVDEDSKNIESYHYSTEEISKKLGHMLVGLKRLEIKRICTYGEEPLTFEFFLRHCKNLVLLRIPEIGKISFNGFRVTRDDGGAIKFIYQPLVEYLRDQLTRKPISGQNPKLRIHFAKKCGTDFLKNSPIFFEIIKLSSQLGYLLFNAPSTLLLSYDNHYLTQDLKEAMDSCVATISVSSETGLSNEIYFPISSTVNVDIFNTSRLQNFSDFILSGSVHKIKLEFSRHCTSGIPEKLQNLFVQLFQIFRPTLKILKIIYSRWQQEQFNSFPLKIPNNFPNLTKLYLSNFNYFSGILKNVEIFNKLLTGLLYLEDLVFKDCTSLTDDGILGMDLEKPLIAQLKHLCHLKLLNCTITDKSFKYGFKYLKLKTFIFQPLEFVEYRCKRKTDDVTFLEGYSSLVSMSNCLCNSLEIFKFNVPSDCTTDEQLQNYLKKFKHLEMFENLNDL